MIWLDMIMIGLDVYDETVDMVIYFLRIFPILNKVERAQWFKKILMLLIVISLRSF